MKQFDLSSKEKHLLAHLRSNARASTTQLARELGLSRGTVTSRIEQLEKRGVIQGYTVILNNDYQRSLIHTQVMIGCQPKYNASLVLALEKIPNITSLHAVNGQYELLAMISADSTQDLDSILDQIGNLDGITKTTSSIILSTKFARHSGSLSIST